MFYNYIHLEAHDILIYTWEIESDSTQPKKELNKHYKLIKDNSICKFLFDYRNLELSAPEVNTKLLPAFINWPDNSSVFYAFVSKNVALLQDNLNLELAAAESEDTLNSKNIKHRVFEDLSIALDWLKSI